MVSIKRNRHKNEVMNKSVCFSAVILSTFLLFVSCKDNRRTSYISNRQENKEFSVSDSIRQKTGNVSLPAKKYAHAATDTKEIGREKGTGENKRNHVSKRLQDFRKRTVSKYFAGTLSDSLSVGRAELKVPRGSMEHAKILSITPLRKGELPHLPAGMVNVTADRSHPTVAINSKDCIAGYRFLPHGEHFVHSPASIAVPYDSTLIPKGYTADDIHTYYYDELTRKWTLLKSKGIDTKHAVAMAETSHFTDVINGIIKVPESPETQSYVPTGISELKAADPGAGIQQIEAPTANQNGTAALSYPFEAPKGRAGIAASAGLQYSSDGSSSYVGYGWSLPVQSIDIETRWGVPRFDTNNESESYLLMGQQLNDRIHRRTEDLARTSEKRFYPMVEGSFNKIIRHGDSPKNYWWEVTSKDGTVYSYGGYNGQVDDETSLTDGNGNRIKWALKRITDVHGNFAAYHYTKSGNNLYPQKYTYTGFGNEEGLYSIEFDIDSTGRKDVVRNGRLGVLQTDESLLKKVSVKNNNELLRAYDLNYEEGIFGKTLLKSVDQKDSKDLLVASQSFSYYNDVAKGIFADSLITYTAQQDDYGKLVKAKIGHFDETLSLLGGGSAKGFTVGAGCMVGGGWGPASANAGSSYTHSESSNEGRIAMIDINGDAMPDKVWKGRDGKLHYRLNMNKDLLHPYFGEARELKGVNSFSKGSTVSHSFDANIGTGFGPISAGFAVSRTIDESKTKIYFQDFNADGLIDIAQNGTVFFNHSDGLNVVFDNKSTNTGNPIVGHAAAIDETFIPDYDAIRDSLEREFPMNDAVRLWRAPYSGTVQVTGTTQKLSSAGDGVGLSIQHNNTVLWHHDHLQSGTLAVPTQTVTVNQGDYLLFRVNAIYSGIGDAVKWDPAIVYTSIAADTYAGEDLKHYKSSQDYIGGESSTAALDINGAVTYDGIYNKQKTSDDVLLAVIKTDKTGRETQIDSLFLPADTIISNGNFSGSYNSVVADSATVDFVIKTTSPINWKHISWAPVFHRDTVNYTLAPKHLMYNKNIVAKADTLVHITTTPDSIWSKELFLVPDFQVNRMSDKDTGEASVYLTVKGDDGSLIYKRTLKLANSNKIQTDTIPVKKPQLISKLLNGKLQVTYSVINELKDATVARLHLYRDSIVMTLGADGKMHPSDTIRVKLATLPASVYSSFNRLDYGLLYKGWGQFGWNGNKKDEAIRVEDMKVSEGNEYIKNGKINTEAVEKNTLDISKQKFFTMGYLPLYKWYRSATDSTYVGASMLRPSRLGVDEIVIDSIKYNTDGDGLPAPVLVSKSKGWGKTFSAGFSWGISLGVNKSNSTQDSYTIVSAMDMNGDSYPDWLNENNGKVKVQLTKPIGTLGENIRYHVENNKFYGEASNEGSNAGLSMDPKAYKLDKFNEELRTAKNAVTKAREALAINPRTKIDAGNASFSGNVSEKSCGASGNFSSGASGAVRNWEDLNGDGLPDMLMKGQVRYNLGYGFTEAIASGTEKMEESWNNNYGSGLGICIPVLGTFSISGGQNGTASLTSSKTTFKDINGDGLPDLIEQNMLGDLKVTLNMGNGFFEQQNLQKHSEILSTFGSSVALYASTAYTIRIPLPFGFVINITPSSQGAHSESISRTTTALLDMDGDGLPDLVYSDGENKVKVRRNITGRTNLLKSVTLPFGGNIHIEYEQTKPSFNLPGRKWVMSSVETTGGYKENGATRIKNTFEYTGGYRDRKERDFYGFRTVRTNQLNTEDGDKLYRYSVQTFALNRGYYTHNLVTDEYLYDADGKKLQGSIYKYDLKKQADPSVIFPALAALVQSNYDEQSGDSLSTRVENTYDAYGNLASYKETATNYELDADIAYHDLQAKYIVSVPKHIAVKDKGGKVYRERSTQINGNGDITNITMHNGTKPSVYDMTYDAYGNLASLTKPENHKGQRMRYDYTYDDVLHMLVTNVKDAYGYTSSTVYDYKWAVPLETSDLNGNKMRYTYDDMGRPSTILGPKEIAAGKPYTIKFEYHPTARYARTVHYAPEGDIETYTFADSLMRAVQTKQTGVVWTGGSNQKVSIVSGRAVVDAFGRTIKAFYPMTESYGSIGTYNTATGDPQATTEYDAYDRTTKVTLPDGATTTKAYQIAMHEGEDMLETTITDALGRNMVQITDSKGRNRETIQHISGDNIIVKYDYDAVGQITTVHHPNDKTTTYEYDLLGHKLKVNHPDAGEVSYTYDAAGNLLTKLTAELKKTISADAPITYTYDYERLSEVLYPKNLFNRVTYTYGKPGEKYNRAGRLVLVEDASGGEAYYYGNQGEVVKTVRSVMVSTADVRTYVYGATYDSWNRVRTMTYPDGEVVTYAYNAAGQIASVKSNKQGKEETIVEKVGYDKDGHTVYTKLGNGTETTYTYDKRRERLQEMNLTAAGTSIMHNKYQYDAVDNILGITNAVDPTRGNTNGDKKLGGAFKHSYAYDDLNRLVYASGKAKQASYSMQMTFGRMSEPLTKVQKVDSTKTAQSYDFTYKYEDSNHPTAPTQIGHEHYTYDANGNPTLVENDSLNTERRMYWDEDNRLMVLSDNGKTCRYTYNAAGERIIKSHGDLEGVYINGAPQGITFHETEDYTIYPAPMITVTKNRFTKHYFIGDKRVASKLGVGKFSNVYGISGNNVTAGQKDYAARMMQIEKQREEYYKSLGTPPGVPTMKGATADPDNTGRGYNEIIGDLGDHSVPEGWVQHPKRNTTPGTPPGPPIQWGAPEDPDNAQPGYGYIPTDTTNTEEIFFYHSDHLGSTSYITGAKANITQFDAYLPYGELLVDEHSSSEDMPYKFNGKELDEETGLYYYGARYYAPKLALFYGVDPIMEKYPNFSGYCYAFDNPIRYIDHLGLGPKERVNAARSRIGTPYKQEMGTLRTAKTPQALKYMDCSEFVCRVMADDNITKGVKSMGTSVLKTFLGNKDKFIHSFNAQVGDIALWEGHTGIVTGVGEHGTINLTHARGEGKLLGENKTAILPSQYRNSKFYGYYRPKNETHDLPLSTTPVENHTTTMLPEIVVTAPRQQRELFTTPINIEIKPIKIEPIKSGK